MPDKAPNDLSENERMDLYSAMMHARNGVCPVCRGRVWKSPVFDSVVCENDDCGFSLNDPESQEISEWRHTFHTGIEDILKRWRAQKSG